MDAKGLSGLHFAGCSMLPDPNLRTLVDTKGDKKQNPSEARIAKLEGTLGQLVSMLQAGNVHGERVDEWSQQQQQSPPQQHQQHQQQPPPPPIIPYPDVAAEGTEGSGAMEDSRSGFMEEDDEDTDSDAVRASASWWGMDNANAFSANGMPVDTPPSSTMSGAFMSPALSPSSVPPSSASISIDTFCSRMLHHFPFVHLPAYLTAEKLRLDRPFLFRAIICVTSVSAKDKMASSLELKRVLYEAAFLQRLPQQKQQQPQQTVDLLLGLLVYIAWGWEHLRSNHSLPRLMAMAISLVGELRFLDQAVPEISRTISHLEPNGGFDNVYGITPATTATTTPTTGAGVTDTQLYLERQRAILGCFVLGSAVSAYFCQVEAPRWTPQMDEALAAIVASGNSAGAECPSDAALAIQVRLQLLATKAAEVRERAQLPDHPPPETLSPQSLLYIKALMGQLQELRASVPPAFQQHFLLLAQTYYTEMCIIETIHIQQSARPPPPKCGPTRISCFWQSALAIKSCTSTFLTLSPSGLLGISFIQWAQLVRCVATLHQLSTLRESGWDPATVRRLVDLPVLLSCTADKLELAAAEAGEQPASADGVFMQLARGLRMFQSSYHDRELLSQQEEAYRAKETGDGVENRADMTMAPVTTTEGDTDALANSQHAGYLMSPTLWLEEIFVGYEDQSIPTM
ncbi:hypothetical protein PENARI_c008G03841 [Penicillium arizonense]|uniref:Transcription factor domain-containing protein n=1 Tax=Penicillium arizonense TaxID=1835702 RepID=A0A1F5LJG4_PENAI|nr:hypothetical protein PENARI_c008G03841 [Penicillium arizonense]OGE53352.1 hypothetical protein PENARI_c008G03841 [Penicillium arizonense]